MKPAKSNGIEPREPGEEEASTTAAEADGHPSRRQELAREVVLELHALRAALEEGLQTFGARVHGELAAAARHLEEAAQGEAETPLPSAKALGVLLHDLRSVKVKPRKGRAKDLTRISRAAEELAELTGQP